MKWIATLSFILFSQIAFCCDGNSLECIYDKCGSIDVKIETKRLIARSIQEDDIEEIKSLFSNEVVMAKFGDGTARSPEDTEERMKKSWIYRWRNGDPKGGLVIKTRSSDEFVGVIIAGESNAPGEAEIAYIIDEPFQNKGYGTEIVSALVKTYAPWVKKNFDKCFKEQRLQTLFASASPDNLPSWKILDNLGFVAYGIKQNQDDEDDKESDCEQFKMYNVIDKTGIERTVVSHPKYGVKKWLFRLNI